MYGRHVVAIYSSYTDAGNTKNRLIDAGIDTGRIRLSSEQGGDAKPASSGGFLSWLFGSDVPDRERNWYDTNLREGRTALSVRIGSDAESTQIEDLLQRSNALEIEDHSGDDLADQKDSPRGAQSDQNEEVIPIVKEELAVGKRETEKRQRIRTHVIERPVEGQVALKDETVIVERRPTSGRATEAGSLQDRDIEIVEKHEEPVVEKRARADEEVVVRKDVRSRTEAVKDTVRETKVDVEDAIDQQNPRPQRAR